MTTYQKIVVSLLSETTKPMYVKDLIEKAADAARSMGCNNYVVSQAPQGTFYAILRLKDRGKVNVIRTYPPYDRDTFGSDDKVQLIKNKS